MMKEDKLTLFNEDELKQYFDKINEKFNKITTNEKRKNWSIFVFFITLFGLIPTFIISSILGIPLDEPVSKNPEILLIWLIFAIIILAPISYYGKKISKLPYNVSDKLFYYLFHAYQNIQSHLDVEDFDLLKKAAEYLEKSEFEELETTVEDAYDVPGIKKSSLSKIKDILHIHKEIVVPHLQESTELEKIVPIIGNFAQFIYAQKNENLELQEKLSDDSISRAGTLKIIQKHGKLNIDNFTSKTYLSKNLIVRTVSFALSLIFIFIIVGLILKSYRIITELDTMAYCIFASLGVSILGGIELAKMYKK